MQDYYCFKEYLVLNFINDKVSKFENYTTSSNIIPIII